MWVFNLGILIVFLIGILCGLKNGRDLIKDIDKKENKLYLLYPLANWILTRTGLEKFLHKKNNITASVKAIYFTGKPEFISRVFWCRRISLVIAVIILFNLLSLLEFLSAQNSSLIIDGKYIERPGYGEGSREAVLNVTLEQTKGEDISDRKKVAASQEVTIDVHEQTYTQEELIKVFDKSFEYLKSNVLGGNKSFDLIYDNLYFCKVIPGTSITADWIPKDYSLIHSDGTVYNEDITADGVATSVTVILSYGDRRMEQELLFHIMPRQYSEEEIRRGRLNQEIHTSSENSATKKLLELPSSLDGYGLIWGEKKENNGMIWLFLGFLFAAAVWLLGDKELEKQMKKRKEQMLIDYPEIINKFTLLINAGMTIKQAWIKIAEDYKSLDSQRRGIKRYAYEEMLTTVRELKLGMPENISYEQYGSRTGLIPFIKFSSLITQNLKKGTKGFTELLMQEAREAFEDRKEIAKRLGEEAGTKLLIPMMIMLIIVFLIIMIPSFLSFRI